MRRVVSVTHDLPPPFEGGITAHQGCRVYWAIDPELFIVGICHVQPSFGSAWVTDLAVDPSVRRQKIGNMIVEKIRSDYHPKSIRGNSDLSAVPFWRAVGARFMFTSDNSEFIIDPRK